MRHEVRGNTGRSWWFDDDLQLGRSSHSEVFEGGGISDESLPAAIKVVSLILDTETERRRRYREAEVAEALLAHQARSAFQHVLVPYDYCFRASDLVIVLPRAAQSLRDIIGGLTTQLQKLEALRDIGNGLVELAELPLLHRDLKPANVLQHEGVWKLADFGISRLLTEDTATFTFMGAGTRPYMAPELWTGSPATVKADLYAWGIIAYELLVGHRPFTGDDLRQQHLTEVPVLPESVPDPLRLLILRLLDKDPAQRPQDARSVLQLLRVQERDLRADQQRLLRAATRALDRDAHQDAADSAEALRLEARASARRQGRANLEMLLETALSQLRDTLPGAALALLGTDRWSIAHGTADVEYHLWQDSDRGADEGAILLAGEVRFRGVRVRGVGKPKADAYPAANLIYRQASGDSWAWFVVSFCRRSSRTYYTAGPRDRPHGLARQAFSKLPPLAFSPQSSGALAILNQVSINSYAATFDTTPLTVDVVAALLEERMALSDAGFRYPTVRLFAWLALLALVLLIVSAFVGTSEQVVAILVSLSLLGCSGRMLYQRYPRRRAHLQPYKTLIRATGGSP